MGLRYLDTGAQYRAMTWWMLHNGVDVLDQDASPLLLMRRLDGKAGARFPADFAAGPASQLPRSIKGALSSDVPPGSALTNASCTRK